MNQKTDFPGIRMGVPRPKTLDEQLAVQSDISSMRKAIIRGQYESALISRCLRMAEAQGLSGEETYVLIAYHALNHLEDFWQERLKLSALDIRTPLMGDQGK